jgi:hypothetical protein
LLMAGAQALTDRYISDRAAQDLSLNEKDISLLHQTLMQNVLHGYDILPTAVHLTASTLALLAPEVAFRNMNLFVMPIGVDHGNPRLGSLDFLSGSEIQTQFALDDTQLDTLRTGAARSAYVNAKVAPLDLCVMNPPFVSSRYGNRLFGSLPDDRPILQKELSRRSKALGVSATAGLGALFVPLAEKHTKPGGRIAFVLPVALATGEAWSAIRERIADRFHLEIVVTSHDSERPNFSENTDLSELLFIARPRYYSQSELRRPARSSIRYQCSLYGIAKQLRSLCNSCRSAKEKFFGSVTHRPCNRSNSELKSMASWSLGIPLVPLPHQS